MASAIRTLMLRELKSLSHLPKGLEPHNLALESLPLTIVNEFCVSTPESIVHHPESTQWPCFWPERPSQ